MRKLIIFTLILNIFYNHAFPQIDTTYIDEVIPSTVILYRLPNYVGSGVRMKIMANDQPIIRLKNASYYSFDMRPGECFLSCEMGSNSGIRLNLEPGRTYYVKCYINMGLWSGVPVLELVDPPSGKAIIDGRSLSLQPGEIISTVKPKSRVGLFLGGGVGFESIPMFIDDNGNEVSLSTGGGFSIGATYGYQFNRHFDLSADCFYQGSTLSRTLKNANASFDRMGVTVTPAFVIPIKGGNFYRFKLGGGPGIYSFGKMYIDASRAGGEKYTYRYKPATGLNASLVFESNFSDHGSLSLGIKYYSIQYLYTSEGSSYYTTERKINNPDGSGIDFTMGYYYHF